MKQVRVMTIFGTRPEAIKMAPLVAELQRRPGLEPVCCVTAQHREMLDSVLEIFQLRPDYDLNIMEPRQTLSTITSKCLLGMEGVLEQARPDLVLVHGCLLYTSWARSNDRAHPAYDVEMEEGSRNQNQKSTSVP